MLSVFDCLLKVYKIKAKGLVVTYTPVCFLQGSAAAELGRGGKF